MEWTHNLTSDTRAKTHQQNQKLRQHARGTSFSSPRARRVLIAYSMAVSRPVGVSGDLDMLTPKVHSSWSGGGPATPNGVVRGSHVRHNTREMRVGVDEFIWSINLFLR